MSFYKINVFLCTFFSMNHPGECGDMDCDGLRRTFVKDVDGSLLNMGPKGALLTQSDYGWNQDPARGLGDDKIPASLTQLASDTNTNAYDLTGRNFLSIKINIMLSTYM